MISPQGHQKKSDHMPLCTSNRKYSCIATENVVEYIFMHQETSSVNYNKLQQLHQLTASILDMGKTHWHTANTPWTRLQSTIYIAD